MNVTQPNTKGTRGHKIMTIVGVVLCVILIPILVMNVTLIIKSYVKKDGVPTVGNHFPMIVLTGSMEPTIKAGDLIICRSVKAEDVKAGDVISFFDPEGNGTSVVTHRVAEVLSENGELQFRTKGDNNDTEDRVAVPSDKVLGTYRMRIPGAGNVAMFMQTTAGLIVCVVLPLILLVGYDFVRRRMYEKSREQSTEELLAELERLKAEKNQKSE